MRVNNTFRKIIDCFLKKHSMFFKSVHALFFFSHALWFTGVRLWQILAKIMFQSLFGSLLNHLYHYANENHLYFIYHLLAQKLFTLWKILPYLQPSIIRVLSKRISLSLKKYICYLPAKVRSVLWKTVTLVLKILKTSVTVFHHFSPWIIFESLNIVLPALNYDYLFVNFIQVVLAN